MNWNYEIYVIGSGEKEEGASREDEIFIQSLQKPKVIEVEIEKELINGGKINDEDPLHGAELIPKIANNKIKITKILG